MNDDDRFIRVLKLKPTAEQARELLRYASFGASLPTIRYLLEKVSRDELNGGVGNSCEALESLVSHSRCSWRRNNEKEEEEKLLECIEFLLDHGARWNPTGDSLRYVRQGLGSHDGKYVVSVIRLLLYTPGAADPARVWELCRTDKLHAKIRPCDPQLWTELLELRPNYRP